MDALKLACTQPIMVNRANVYEISREKYKQTNKRIKRCFGGLWRNIFLSYSHTMDPWHIKDPVVSKATSSTFHASIEDKNNDRKEANSLVQCNTKKWKTFQECHPNIVVTAQSLCTLVSGQLNAREKKRNVYLLFPPMGSLQNTPQTKSNKKASRYILGG